MLYFRTMGKDFCLTSRKAWELQFHFCTLFNPSIKTFSLDFIPDKLVRQYGSHFSSPISDAWNRFHFKFQLDESFKISSF